MRSLEVITLKKTGGNVGPFKGSTDYLKKENVKPKDDKNKDREMESSSKKKSGYLSIGVGIGAVTGGVVSQWATKALRSKISKLKSKPTLTPKDKILLKKLRKKLALIRVGSSVGGGLIGGIAANKYSKRK